MTNGPRVEELLGRVRRFEEELSSIGVSVKVDVRGLDADTHEYGAHDVETCAPHMRGDWGKAEGRDSGSRPIGSRVR